MRILAACSLGGAGHLEPLLSFVRAARRHGHETLVVAPPGLQGLARVASVAFWPGGEPPEAVVAPIREQLPVVPPAEASRLANRELFGRIATTAMLPAMNEALLEWRPDLVLREPCEYSSAVVGGRLGIPIAQVAVSLAQVETASIATASPELEAFQLHLSEDIMSSPYLSRFPASLDPSEFPTTVRYHDASASARRLPADLERWWVADDRPRIYLTFGTVLGYMSIARAIYAMAIEALAGLDARVLLTVGRHFDPTALGDLPANVRVEAWVEQSDALEGADLVVCHGGSGTVLGAIAAGVPVVIAPIFADQLENARAIVSRGAGLLVESGVAGPTGRHPTPREDAVNMTRAVELALSSRSLRAEAGRLADEIAATPTVEEILETLVD